MLSTELHSAAMIQSPVSPALAVENQRTKVTNSRLSSSKAAVQKRGRKHLEDSSCLPNIHTQIPKLGKDSIGWRTQRREIIRVQVFKSRC